MLVIGRVQVRRASSPVLVASVVGDVTCAAWGVKHTVYQIAITGPDGLDARTLLAVVVAAIAFGLAGAGASRNSTHTPVNGLWKRFIPNPLLRPSAGAAVIIALVYLLDTRDYLGIGVTAPRPRRGHHSVVLSSAGGAHAWRWFWKLLFTAITLCCGFKGGEVSPLFFIGAALGNPVAALTGMLS